MLDKYMRRDYSIHPDVFQITYMQFSKRYTPVRKGPKDMSLFKPMTLICETEEFEELQKLDFIITHDFESRKLLKRLPMYIELTSLFWENQNI